MNQVLVITSPDEVRKKVPFLSPLSSMKWRIAAIGHSSSPVTHLSQNRSLEMYLDHLVCHPVINCHEIHIFLSKDLAESGRSSPSLKTPKNAVLATAHTASL